MKKPEKTNYQQLYVEMAEIIRIANKAVKEAKEENLKLGIPDTFYKNGKVYYVLLDGTITDKRPPQFA